MAQVFEHLEKVAAPVADLVSEARQLEEWQAELHLPVAVCDEVRLLSTSLRLATHSALSTPCTSPRGTADLAHRVWSQVRLLSTSLRLATELWTSVQHAADTWAEWDDVQLPSLTPAEVYL